MKRPTLFAAMLLLVAGCRVYDTYQPPCVEMPEVWKESPAEAEDNTLPLADEWWTVFDEADLNELVQKAMASNPSLDEALWRIAQAEAVVIRAESFWYPTVEFNPNTQNSVQRANFSGIPDAAAAKPRFKATQYQFPFNAFYDIDLWGKIAYTVDSALANLGAETYAYYTALLDLQSTVADAYFTIRTLDAQDAVLISTIGIRQDALDINNERYRAGLANFTDVSQADTELQLAKADFAQNKIERAIQEHRLAALLGEVPACFTFPYAPLDANPPELLPTVPCDVLMSRPDVQEAERRLAALFADEGVAYASFFPSFDISAQIGYQSNLASDLLQWQSRLWLFGTNLLQTVFDAGRKQSDYDAARAKFQQGLASYATIVLNAIKEVEDALARIRWLKDQYKALDAASNSALTTRDLSNDRYLRGLVNYLQVVTAERTLLSTRLSAIRTKGEEYQAAVQLMRSLGGKALLGELRPPDPLPKEQAPLESLSVGLGVSFNF